MSELWHVYLLMLQINNKNVPQKHYAQVQTIHRFICTKNTVSFFFLCSQTDFSGKIADDYIEHLQNLECKLSVFSLCVCVYVAFSGSVSQGQRPSEKSSGHPREQGQTSQEVW